MENQDELSKLSYIITGAIFEVSHTLGCGFLEAVYQEALELELKSRGLKVEPQKKMKVSYKGTVLQCEYVPDIIVEGRVIIELKATNALDNINRAQILNYLRVSNLPFGVLVNFGTPRVQIERYENKFKNNSINPY